MAESEVTKQVEFDINERVMTGEMRAAEQTISAAVRLMARYAVDSDGKTMPVDQFVAIIDQTDELEFWQLFARFRQANLKKVIAGH